MQIPKSITDLTYRIIGACMEVHRTLGPGFPEEFYQKALEHELALQKIDFEPQKHLLVEYKGKQVGLCYLDFLIENKLILEIKALSQIDGTHRAQVIKYLTAMKLDVALLVNFGATSLQHERILPPMSVQEHRIRSAD